MYQGNRLKELLALKHMSQRDLMEQMGWKQPNSVTNFMNNNPTAESLDKVASVLGVSVSYFFDEGERGARGYFCGNMDNHNSFNQAEGVDKALSLLEQSIKDKIESSQREARLSDRLIAELEARVASKEAQLAKKK